MIKIVLSGSNDKIINKLLNFANNELRQELATDESNYNIAVVPDPKQNIMQIAPPPVTESDLYSLEKEILNIQLASEKDVVNLLELKNYNPNNTIIIFGRGIMDGVKEVEKETLAEILKDLNISEKDALDRYDIVFHFASKDNEIDEKIEDAWIGCSGYTKIYTKSYKKLTNYFEDKIKSLLT